VAHSEDDLPTPTQLVGQQVRAARRRQGWTAERLGEEMTKVGFSWDRFVVTKLETGKRQSVSVDELLALAVALNLPGPLALLLPIKEDDQVGAVAPADPIAVTRTTKATWYEFASWLRGRIHLAPAEQVRGQLVTGFLYAVDRYEQALRDEDERYRRLLDAEVQPASPDILRATRTMHARSALDVIDAVQSLLLQGVEPPPPRDLARIIEHSGHPSLPAEVAEFVARAQDRTEAKTTERRGARRARR